MKRKKTATDYLERMAKDGDHNAKVLLGLLRKDPMILKAHADALAKIGRG